MNKNSKSYRKKELKNSAIENTSERLTGKVGRAMYNKFQGGYA